MYTCPQKLYSDKKEVTIMAAKKAKKKVAKKTTKRKTTKKRK